MAVERLASIARNPASAAQAEAAERPASVAKNQSSAGLAKVVAARSASAARNL